MTSKLLTGSLFAALLLWLGYYLSQPQDPLIPASHHHIQYTGRIDLSTPDAPVFSWPGTMIQTGFTGRSLALVMDDHYGMNYFNVFLDQDWENPIVIKGEKGRKTYLIADNLTDGEHLLTDEQRVAVYYDFIKRIRSHYPEAFIVCTLGTMDAAKPGSPWPDYIHAAVEQWKTETADERIDVMIFELKDFYKHPRVHHHQENAEVLTAFIKEKMDW